MGIVRFLRVHPMDMKRDGRTLDHRSLEAIRLMAVKRVREGEPAAKVIEAYGFNRTTIYKWFKAAMQPGLGIRALRSTRATGRPRTLTPRQEAQVFRLVNGRNRRQGNMAWTSGCGPERCWATSSRRSSASRWG